MVICRGVAQGHHAGLASPVLQESHSIIKARRSHFPPPKLPLLPHPVAPLPDLGHHHFPTRQPSPSRQGRQPQADSYMCRLLPASLLQGLTHLWYPNSATGFLPGTSVSASAEPHPRKTTLPANRLSPSLRPKLQPHSSQIPFSFSIPNKDTHGTTQKVTQSMDPLWPSSSTYLPRESVYTLLVLAAASLDTPQSCPSHVW